MQERTRRYTVHFAAPFMLDGLDAPQPPGDYEIESDEEVLESPGHTAYRRVATFIHLPAILPGSLSRQMVPVDAAELDAVLAADAGRM